MKTILAFIFALLISFGAHADTVDVKTLPPELSQRVREHQESLRRHPVKLVEKSETLRNEATQWGELIGSALLEGARKTNMVVEDFSKTTVGKITIFIVVYKVIGRDMIRLAIGFIVGAIGLSYGLMIFRSAKPRHEVTEYQAIPYLFGLWVRKIPVKYDTRGPRDIDGGAVIGSMVVSAISVLMACAVAFM